MANRSVNGRIRFFQMGLTVLSLVMCALLAKADSGTTVSASYSNAAGTRSYSVYVPAKMDTQSGLLVVLHGCFMTGDQMAKATQLNEQVGDQGYVVIYPEETYFANSEKCWNWFDPDSQKRGSGEASIIVGMVQDTLAKYSLNPKRVFVTGLSAGAAMAANLLGCYSDIFAGGLVNSGLEFAAAQNLTAAQAAETYGAIGDLDAAAKQALTCSPPRSSPIKVLLVHGSADSVVNPVNADRSFSLFNKINTQIFLAGGGALNQISTQKSHLAATDKQEAVDITETTYANQMAVKEYIVQGMKHAWSGGQSGEPFMDPQGLSSTQLILNELLQ